MGQIHGESYWDSLNQSRDNFDLVSPTSWIVIEKKLMQGVNHLCILVRLIAFEKCVFFSIVYEGSQGWLAHMETLEAVIQQPPLMNGEK